MMAKCEVIFSNSHVFQTFYKFTGKGKTSMIRPYATINKISENPQPQHVPAHNERTVDPGNLHFEGEIVYFCF